MPEIGDRSPDALAVGTAVELGALPGALAVGTTVELCALPGALAVGTTVGDTCLAALACIGKPLVALADNKSEAPLPALAREVAFFDIFGNITMFLLLLLPLPLLAILTGCCDTDSDPFCAWARGMSFIAILFSCFIAPADSFSSSGLLEGALFLPRTGDLNLATGMW